MPSAVESTTTTAGLDAGGMRSSTERGDDNDEDEHQPLQSTYRSWASSTIPRAATSVDARTACSGTSSTRSAARLVLKGRAPVRPRRVESGSGAWRRGGWERGDAGGIPSDARTSTRCTCRTRDVSCVGMGSVKKRPGATDAGCSDRHRTAAGSASPFEARNFAFNVHIWG